MSKNNHHSFRAYTLPEAVVVLSVSLFLLALPIVSLGHWQEQVRMQQFFSNFEQRVHFTQQAAILSQQPTSLTVSKDKKQILFSVPKRLGGKWQILSIPKETTLRRFGTIRFNAYSGNNSSLKAYQFSLEKKHQRVTYQFQIGSGRYVKKTE